MRSFSRVWRLPRFTQLGRLSQDQQLSPSTPALPEWVWPGLLASLACHREMWLNGLFWDARKSGRGSISGGGLSKDQEVVLGRGF